jgi:hypothetical protein
VFARGMDFTDLGQVINYELPNGADRDTYIHRIGKFLNVLPLLILFFVGRTGRLNADITTSFFDPNNQADREIAPKLVQVCQLFLAFQSSLFLGVGSHGSICSRPHSSSCKPIWQLWL